MTCFQWMVYGVAVGSLYPNFRNFQLQFQDGNFSRNILYDHSISVGTSLKTLTLTCPYKNIRKAQRQHRLIFQCFFSDSYNFTHKLSNKWAHVCTFSEGGKKNFKLVVWVGCPRKSGKKEKEINFIFPRHICKVKW